MSCSTDILVILRMTARSGYVTACSLHSTGGERASEGTYVDGLEDGFWRDFHENGLVAAEGSFAKGLEAGAWRYWNADGTEAVNI